MTESTRADTKLLRVDDLSVGYGRVRVLEDVSVTVPAAAVTAVLGSNGAGKSTLLRAISGMLTPTKGRIWFAGRDITGVEPTAIVQAGVAHVLEGRRLFASQSVRDNLMLGLWKTGTSRAEQRRRLEEILAQFPILADRLNKRAGELSGGQQQMLAIAQALMRSPKLIMLDEPTVGLAPVLVAKVFDIVKDLRDRGCGVLLVEQDAKRALSVADDVYVLQSGRVVVHAEPAQVGEDELRRAYLGSAADHP